jgi:RNA polymerase sigma factor (sigma-70 family)
VADDLLQETFLRIHRNVHTLNESDRLAAWVYRIARNVIHDHYRAKNGDVSLADMDVAEENEGQNQLNASAGMRDAVRRWARHIDLAQLFPAIGFLDLPLNLRPSCPLFPFSISLCKQR